MKELKMKELIIKEIKNILESKTKDLWFNNNTVHHQEWNFGECIPFAVLKEYLLENGYTEDEEEGIWDKNGWVPDYWYYLISPEGKKCYVEGNTYYGTLKLRVEL